MSVNRGSFSVKRDPNTDEQSKRDIMKMLRGRIATSRASSPPPGKVRSEREREREIHTHIFMYIYMDIDRYRYRYIDTYIYKIHLEVDMYMYIRAGATPPPERYAARDMYR